jgi:hypothetical protein
VSGPRKGVKPRKGVRNLSRDITEYVLGRVASFQIDGNGGPMIETRRLFISGLAQTEAAAVDPVTGDVLFSTFSNGNRIIRVQGFVVPDPGATGACAAALCRALRCFARST